MKKVIKTVSMLILGGFMACTNAQTPGGENGGLNPAGDPSLAAQQDATATQAGLSQKKIKVAILLDTSGSMDGLIEQAKNQLWKIVNQLAKATDENGLDPKIELALYQYGNDGIAVTDGYVEMIHSFTSELDEISERLFALKTNGGSEYCGTVIKKSIQDLKWSDSQNDLQLIFICGNEEFTQGSIPYQTACNLAKNKNVVVNTIFCGDYKEGVRTFWQHGAQMTKGKYMNIDHDAQIVHITSPYDVQINQLNIQLNGTYIGYGAKGKVKKEKQIKEDANAMSLGSANMTTRAMSKSGKAYKNSSWDLVDAVEEEDFEVAAVADSALPEEMKDMTTEEKEAYVADKKKERQEIKDKISKLGKQREAYVAKERAKNASNASNQLDDVMISAIVEQAKRMNFKFE